MPGRELFYHGAGIAFLALARLKYALTGYSSPKAWDLSQTDRCITYDFNIVDNWLARLERYTGSPVSLAGRTVLELGPGSDLGIGLYVLARGAARYHACDVNDLAGRAPASFYDRFFARLREKAPALDPAPLREELAATLAGRPARLNYVVRDDFDLVAACGGSTIDLAMSHASFEHFDDVPATIDQLSAVCRPGALMSVQVDLRTHSRWIRSRDPNNIYRYGDGLYRSFWFRGQPNRVRPYEYRRAFEAAGWTDVEVTPAARLDGVQRHSLRGLHARFADPINQMDHLAVVLCGRRG